MPVGLQTSLAAKLRSGPAFALGEEGWRVLTLRDDENGARHELPDVGLRVESHYQRRGSGVVIRHTLVNIESTLSPALYRLEPLHLIFDVPITGWRALTANGGVTQGYYPPEAFRLREYQILGGKVQIESHPLGKSSNQHLPLIMACCPHAKGCPGFFWGLEWSAHWYLHVSQVGKTQATSVVAGIKVNGVRLQPHERLELPAVHLGCFAGGFERGTNALRTYLGAHVCPPVRPSPPPSPEGSGGQMHVPLVTYDHWFGVQMNFDAEFLQRQADRAAELGVELFVLDAGWFEGGFPAGLGNWECVDRTRLPGSLEGLAEYVRSRGMQFGLWFGIERACANTSALIQHPQWFVAMPWIDGSTTYHLNLAHREAQDWAIQTIGGWIERLDLRWTRWDYNIDPQPFWERADPTGKIQFDYMRGLYRVLDTLIAQHPNWRVECCAGGGRRIDLGTLRRAHCCWISDSSWMGSICRAMQARANRFLPGHLLNQTIPTSAQRSTDDYSDAAVLGRMLGKLSIDGDIASLPAPIVERFQRWIERFKTVRHLLSQDFYQLLPAPQTADDPDVLQFVSRDGTDSAVFAFAGDKPFRRTVRLRGLLGVPWEQTRLRIHLRGGEAAMWRIPSS